MSSISQKFLNLDSYYRRTTGNKIIVNDLSYFKVDDIELINSSLMTIYDTDTMSTVPTCDCGNYTGNYLVDRECPECGSLCKDPTSIVEPLLWLKSLTADIKFLNPGFWLMFKTVLNKKIDYLRWLSDPKYNPPIEPPIYITGIKDTVMGGVRSYDVMVENIPNIITYLLSHAKFKDPDKQETLITLLKIYNSDKQDLFTEFIPIVNKKLFVMENTNKGKYTNLAVAEIIDVIMSWVKTVSESKLNRKKMLVTTAVVISKLSILYYDYFENYVVKKIGIFRKHVYGARSHFTFRAVITSISGRHQHDQIFVPKAIGVTAFRPHLLNKLVKKYGYTFKKASKLLFNAVKNDYEIIDKLLEELIAESPYDKGIPVLATRNQ